MPIDLGKVINQISDTVFGSPLLSNVFSNSIIVAVVIALLMIVLIMIMYPAKAGTPLSVVLKIFFYMCIGTALIMVLHDGVVKHNNKKVQDDSITGGFVGGFANGGADPSYGSTYLRINPHVPMTNTQPVEHATNSGATASKVNDTSPDVDTLNRIYERTLVGPKPQYQGGKPPNPYE